MSLSLSLLSLFDAPPAPQSRGLGFLQALDLRQALGEELEDPIAYTQWPKLIRQVLGASVLVSLWCRMGSAMEFCRQE